MPSDAASGASEARPGQGYPWGKAGADVGALLERSDGDTIGALKKDLRDAVELVLSDDFLRTVTTPAFGSVLVVQQYSRPCFNMLIPAVVFLVLWVLQQLRRAKGLPSAPVTCTHFKYYHSLVMETVSEEQNGTLKVNGISPSAATDTCAWAAAWLVESSAPGTEEENRTRFYNV
eukprot:CAMPEP_0182863516 /NCGR_PEP_ID=MMETSP0034_2-20130328/6690_1 /TAXON_ID=156128 /ORGANISM="Nephroselmis pyriformis, Strain CCMP717" /LENGTH=174 /DNA_ID=CAMNT_0024995733 /DNA_START=158 /DNA_END=680 /DNA_ORIENTATION=-